MDSTQLTSEVKYVTHLVWADDEDESLCGLDVSNIDWEGIVVKWCPDCTKVERFLGIFESFNATYDVKDSIHAAFQVMKN